MCRNGIIGCRNCIAKPKNKSILQRRSDRQITSNSKRTSNNKKKRSNIRKTSNSGRRTAIDNLLKEQEERTRKSGFIL